MTQPHPDPAQSRSLALWFWRRFLRPRRGLIVVAIILMAIEGSMLGLLSYLLQPMFDQVLIAGSQSALWSVGLAILALFFVRGSSTIGQRVLMSLAMERTGAHAKHDLLTHLMRLDTVFHQSNPPGYLIERVHGDVTASLSSMAAILTGLGRDVIALISLFTVAVLVDPLWTAVALVGVPLLIGPSVLAQRFTRFHAREAREVAGGMSTRLDEIFHGINPIKLNRLEGYQARRYDGLLRQRVKVEVKTSLGKALIPGMIDIMTGLGFLAVLYFGGREIMAGEKTVGEFMSFFTAMALMFEPLRRLGALSGMWQATAASLERVHALFQMEPTVQTPGTPLPPPEALGDIVLQDVSMAYGDLPVLSGLSFRARAGQTTALVGASGAGKSTVFNVLTRLVEVESGSVTIGDVPIGAMRLDDLRGLFAVVTQEALLFDETIRENLLIGRTDIDAAAIDDAVRAAHLTDTLKSLPQGLETPAGPRGSNLSGGQRQRVAIARALLGNAPILLLDEATSALDAKSEAAVQDALDLLAKDRTTLVIAHRLSTVRDADKIVVMDQGRVVDEGTHEELLSRGGVYRNLYELQFSES